MSKYLGKTLLAMFLLTVWAICTMLLVMDDQKQKREQVRHQERLDEDQAIRDQKIKYYDHKGNLISSYREDGALVINHGEMAGIRRECCCGYTMWPDGSPKQVDTCDSDPKGLVDGPCAGVDENGKALPCACSKAQGGISLGSGKGKGLGL